MKLNVLIGLVLSFLTLTIVGCGGGGGGGSSDPNAPATVAVTSSGTPFITTNVTITAQVKKADGTAVADGTNVTFATTRGTLTPTVVTTTGGVATTTLTSPTVGAATVTATAGGASNTVALTFKVPVTATLKLSTAGQLPTGVTKITSIIGNLSLESAGVTVKTVSNANSATGISVDPAVLALSGAALNNAVLLPAEVTPATPTTKIQVSIPLVSITNGFDLGEFATIVTDVAAGTVPTRSDFVLSGFTIIGKDANGATVTMPDVTVDFALSLQ